jgi:hypothetical protein
VALVRIIEAERAILAEADSQLRAAMDSASLRDLLDGLEATR